MFLLRSRPLPGSVVVDEFRKHVAGTSLVRASSFRLPSLSVSEMANQCPRVSPSHTHVVFKWQGLFFCRSSHGCRHFWVKKKWSSDYLTRKKHKTEWKFLSDSRVQKGSSSLICMYYRRRCPETLFVLSRRVLQKANYYHQSSENYFLIICIDLTKTNYYRPNNYYWSV